MFYLGFRFSCLFLTVNYVMQMIYYLEYVNFFRKTSKNTVYIYFYLLPLSVVLYGLSMIKMLPIIFGYFSTIIIFYLCLLPFVLVTYLYEKKTYDCPFSKQDIINFTHTLAYFIFPFPIFCYFDFEGKDQKKFWIHCLAILFLFSTAFLIVDRIGLKWSEDTYLCTFSVYTLDFSVEAWNILDYMNFSRVTFFINFAISCLHFIICFVLIFFDFRKSKYRDRNYEMASTTSPTKV